MSTKGQTLLGAEIFFECLKKEGVDYIFGYPGGALLKIYEKLYDVDHLKHILVRHEQGATHMAEGYARATGKVGVVLVTSGPGATNTVTGIANAYMDSSPIVVFTGQVPTHLIGNDAFQEADILGITRPITKYNFLVKDIKELAPTIRKAFYLAKSGRPGPVLVDLPKDVMNQSCAFHFQDKVDIRGYKPTFQGHSKQIKKAASKILHAKRPLLYVGGGVIMSEAAKELTFFAQSKNIPVTTTLQGLGAFPGDDPLSLGMLGMHGTYWANQAVSNCDVMISLGARFDDRVTGKLETFSPNSYKIHVDIDPTNIDKNILVDLPIVGDVKHILSELIVELNDAPDTKEWLAQIDGWRKECPLHYETGDGKLRTEYVLERITEKTNHNAVVVGDVGQHQMWIAQYVKFNSPRTQISSAGLGTMGFSLPAAIGAAFGIKDKPVFSISGDGGFMMNIQELNTAAYNKLPLKIVLINNSYLGMVRQWQELFHDQKYSFTNLSEMNPEYQKVVESFGIPSMSTDNPDEVDGIIDKMLAYNDGPIFAEFKVVKEDMVFPMVPAGASISDMMIKRLNPKTFV